MHRTPVGVLSQNALGMGRVPADRCSIPGILGPVTSPYSLFYLLSVDGMESSERRVLTCVVACLPRVVTWTGLTVVEVAVRKTLDTGVVLAALDWAGARGTDGIGTRVD